MTRNLRRRARALVSGNLSRNTLGIFAFNIARLATQMLWVIVLAAILGPDGYGTFSGVAGFAVVAGGLVGFGFGLRMYQDVARNHSLLGQRWAETFRVFTFSSLLLSVIWVLVAIPFFAQVPLGLLLLIAVSEVIVTPIFFHISFAYAAAGRVVAAAAVPVTLSISRLIAALSLLLLSPGTDFLQAYVVLHSATTIISAGAVWFRFSADIAPPPSSITLDRAAFRESGRLGALWASAQTLGAFDKALSLRIGGAEMAGHYTAANRVMGLIAAPIDALATAAMPRLFRAGGGEALPPRLLRLLFFSTLVYGGVAGVGLYLVADLIPLMLGEAFRPTVAALHILSAAVVPFCLRIISSNIALGFGWIRLRLLAEFLTVLVVALTMTVLIPSHGLTGAAYSLVLSETFLCIALWTIVIARRPPAKRR